VSWVLEGNREDDGGRKWQFREGEVISVKRKTGQWSTLGVKSRIGLNSGFVN
jgi:hypothetical protein